MGEARNHPVFSRTTWILIPLVVTVVLITAGYAYYSFESRRITHAKYEDIAAVADLKIDNLLQWTHERKGNAGVFSANRFLRETTRQLIDGAAPEGRLSGLRGRLELARREYGYVDVLIFDAAGNILFSLRDEPGSPQPATRNAIAETFSDESRTLSDLYRGKSGAIHIDTTAPITDPTGEVIAALLLRSDADVFLYPLLQTWPTPSRSAETFLVRREQDDVLFLNDLRHLPDSAMSLRYPLSAAENPAVNAATGTEGMFTGTDYREKRVLADLRPVMGTQWFMITKVDTAEILAEARYRAVMISLFVLFGILLAAAGSAHFYKRQQARIYRVLYDSEKKQREMLEEFRTTLYSIGEAVIITDREGKIRYVNPAAETLTGFSGSVAVGMPIEKVFSVISEKTRKPVENPVNRALREKKVSGATHPILLVSANGRTFPVADNSSPIYDEKGTIVGAVLVFRDQTEERAAQKAIEENEARFRALANSGQALVWASDADKKWIYFNERWLAFTGRPLQDEYGFGWTRGVHPEDLDAFMALYRQSFDRRKPFSRVYRLRRHDGEYRWIQNDGTPWYDTDGHFIGYIGHILDITRQVETERKRQELENQFRQSQKMEAIGKLAGGLAHDFNNMLSIINGYAELALQVLDEKDPVHPNIKEIQAAGIKSANLVRQLLAFARKQSIDPVILNLNDTVHGMLRMLQRLLGEHIEMHWHPDKNLRPVRMDPSQLEQVLANLTINARDAIDGVGRITIETSNTNVSEEYCRTHAEFPRGEFVMLSVSDNGSGMDPQTMESIYDPFFSTKSPGKGTGMGLSTVYGVIRQHNGFIHCCSEPGQGTTFRIYLPPCDPTREETDARTTDTSFLAPKEQPGAEKILLTEDNPELLELTATMLRKLGHTVFPAASPEEAIRIAREYEEDIHTLITDVIMPKMNGRDLMMHISRLRPGINVLFISGYTAEVIDKHHGMEKELVFLQKPFSIQELAAKLREAAKRTE